VAYYVAEKAIEASELRSYLSRKLPGYMIPAYFVYLESMPLTPNGKINRKALPDPMRLSPHEYTAPKNEWEQEVLAIWQKVLNTEDIGTDVNFFLIGGNSLKLIHVFRLIDERYPKTIKVMNLFENRTIASLAECIREKTGNAKRPEKKNTIILDF
jgi:acyl carrier protein